MKYSLCSNLFFLLPSPPPLGVLRHVLEGCVDRALVVDLCEKGDQMILEETKKVYKKEKEMKKGRREGGC